MCSPHLRNFDITNHKPSLPSYCEKDLAFGFFSHYIIIADIDRLSPIAEQHAGCLWFNDAPTYHTTHDERQKHLSDVFYCSSHSPLSLCFEVVFCLPVLPSLPLLVAPHSRPSCKRRQERKNGSQRNQSNF